MFFIKSYLTELGCLGRDEFFKKLFTSLIWFVVVTRVLNG